MKNYFVYPQYNSALTNGYEISILYNKNINSAHLHSHQFYEIYLLCDGELTFAVASTNHNLTGQTVLVIPPNSNHSMKLADTCQYYSRIVLWVSADIVDKIVASNNSYTTTVAKPWLAIPSVQQFATLQNCCALIEAEQTITENTPHHNNQYSYMLLGYIIEQLHRIQQHSHQEDDSFSQKIKQYLLANMHKQIQLDQLSQDMYVSKYHLMRTFKKQTGYSVHKYLTNLRMSHAKRLIAQGVPCEQACGRCGYLDYSTFYKAFVAQYNISPANYARAYHTTARR